VIDPQEICTDFETEIWEREKLNFWKNCDFKNFLKDEFFESKNFQERIWKICMNELNLKLLKFLKMNLRKNVSKKFRNDVDSLAKFDKLVPKKTFLSKLMIWWKVDDEVPDDLEVAVWLFRSSIRAMNLKIWDRLDEMTKLRWTWWPKRTDMKDEKWLKTW